MYFLFTGRWVYKCERLVIGGSRRVRRHSVVREKKISTLLLVRGNS